MFLTFEDDVGKRKKKKKTKIVHIYEKKRKITDEHGNLYQGV